MRYCAECGHELGEREVGGKRRPACPACGAVVFQDPKLAVAVLIEREGRLLMGRRGPNSSAAGKWSFPAGFVDRGERVEDAATREVREETGLEVAVGELLLTADLGPYVVDDFAAEVTGGTLAAGDDALDARWVDVAAMRALPLVDGLWEALAGWDALPRG